MFKKTVVRAGQAEIAFQLLVNIDQRRRRPDAWLHAETQPMGLARSMIGVLPQYYHADPIERGQVERTKKFLALGINLFARRFLPYQEFPQGGHVIAVKFTGEGFLPAIVQFYAVIHDLLIASRY